MHHTHQRSHMLWPIYTVVLAVMWIKSILCVLFLQSWVVRLQLFITTNALAGSLSSARKNGSTTNLTPNQGVTTSSGRCCLNWSAWRPLMPVGRFEDTGAGLVRRSHLSQESWRPVFTLHLPCWLHSRS